MIKKYWWIIGGGIILLLTLLLWPKSQKKTLVEKPALITIIRDDQYLPVDLPKTKSVNWLVSENIELPKIQKIKIKRQVVEAEREIKIKELLGINSSNGYVDKENNIVGFTEGIESPEQLPTEGTWEIEGLKNKLKKITEDINGKGGLEIEWTNVGYKKILYPRWIESTEKEARGVEIRGDYVIDSTRVTTYHGESIVGIFNKEGKLVKITLSLIPEIVFEEGVEQLININEASKSPIDIYRVVDNAGIEAIDKINVTQAKIVLIYDNKRNIIKPYYWLDGNTYTGKVPVKVSLIVKAEK